MADLRRATAQTGVVALLMALGACTHRTPGATSTPNATPTLTATPTPTSTAPPTAPAGGTPPAPSSPPTAQGTPKKAALDHVAVIVMAGDVDLTTPTGAIRLWAKHLKSYEWVLITEAGHSVAWEQPEAFNKAVLDFVRKH